MLSKKEMTRFQTNGNLKFLSMEDSYQMDRLYWLWYLLMQKMYFQVKEYIQYIIMPCRMEQSHSKK